MSGLLTIKKLKFIAGPAVGAPPLEIEPSTVVVLVGPNNSGKSLTLREIEDWCWGTNAIRKVVSEIEVEFPQDANRADALINVFKTNPPEGQSESVGHVFVGLHTFRANQPTLHQQLSMNELHSAVSTRNQDQLRNYLLRFYTARLDGRTRFALADPKQSGDLQLHPQNHLWALFQNDDAREKVRQLTEEAFGLNFVIDPTAMTQFRIRMSERPPQTKAEEQALDANAREFHRNAKLISELSDGVQAFTGLVSAVMSLPHKVLLIDEPEAFLHPPLARRLGQNLASLATERGASLIVATHSAEFLVGCIERTPNTTIIRLTYDKAIATARTLSADQLTDLMSDPLLRSTGALRGLFHRAVIVTESDTDRAFYDEINRRLLDARRGIDDGLFLNAQNWQTVSRIIGPLRLLGIPSAAIMDLDALSEGAGWPAIYDVMAIDQETRTSLEQKRVECENSLKGLAILQNGQKAYKVQGIAALPDTNRVRTEQLIQDLAQYGIFIVPVGELERWLAPLAIHAQKSEWLVNVFGMLGTDSASSQYVRPGNDDVWAFLEKISSWTEDPSRKGIA